MRVLSIGSAGICILALIGVMLNKPEVFVLMPSIIATVMACAFVLVPGVTAQFTVFGLTMFVVAQAVFRFATQQLWLDTAAATFLALLALILVACAALFGWSNTQVIFPNVVLLKINRPFDNLQVFPGPARLLNHPFARSLAMLPRGRHEFTMRLENVDTMPHDTPFGPADQKIKLLQVEIVYTLQSARFERVFTLPNQSERFKAAAAALGMTVSRAMIDPAFWSYVWREALSEAAERIVREHIHRSGLGPLDVDRQRGAIAEEVRAELAVEANLLALSIRELSFLHVEPDLAATSLHERAAYIEALNRIEELHLTGEAISDFIRRLNSALPTNGPALSDTVIETLLLSIFNTPINTTRIQSNHRSEALNAAEVGYSAQPRPIR
jgi:hypothetical protein